MGVCLANGCTMLSLASAPCLMFLAPSIHPLQTSGCLKRDRIPSHPNLK